MRIGWTGLSVAQAAVARALEAAGHVLVPRGELADAVLVDGAQGSEGITAALASLARGGHLVLVSSHAVYPAVESARPWREDDWSAIDDAGPGASSATRRHRAAERELVLGAGRGLVWTVLRPAIVEGADEPVERTSWLLSRLLDGGPLVLPDDGPRLYRAVGADDLAAAVRRVVGESRAFGKVLNVAGEGVLTPLGHALMLMDGLGRRVPVHWVPGESWRRAGLKQPMFESETTSFIETSTLLTQLGWVPQPELERVETLGRVLAQRPARRDEGVVAERRLFEQVRRSSAWDVAPGRGAEKRAASHWRLQVSPGQPASLRTERLERAPVLGIPLLKTLALSLTEATERLLTGDQPAQPEPIVPGHVALFEVIEGGPQGPRPGCRVIATARPVGEPERFAGIDFDGFAASAVSISPEYLLEVPESLGRTALLAHPLARLQETVRTLLEGDSGSVWILGTSVDAALAAWLVHDAGREILVLDRMPGELRTPLNQPVLALARISEEVSNGFRPGPTLALNLSGAREGEWLLERALGEAGLLVTPMARAPSNRIVRLPPAARSRESLVQALETLVRWSAVRDLEALVGPRVDPLSASDALLSPPFTMAWIGPELA